MEHATPKLSHAVGPHALPTAPGSPNIPKSGHRKRPRSVDLGFRAYPTSPESCLTPPATSPSSLGSKEDFDLFEASAVVQRKPSGFLVNPRFGTINAPRIAMSRMQSDRSRDSTRPFLVLRSSHSLNPLTSVTSDSSVHAAHLSNPTTPRPSMNPSIIAGEKTLSSAYSSLTSFFELMKLTNDVAAMPRVKNTPPLTPRALSNDGLETINSASSHANPLLETGLSNGMRSAPRKASKVSNASGPVNPPRGKLWVKISRARGLRPSYGPYVVCNFEWNESIAEDPKHDESMIDTGEGKIQNKFLGGVPIKRSTSEMGRSMAIPMKSRQSSTTSLSDHNALKVGMQLTDPRWDHEAVLCVKSFMFAA